MNAQMNIWTEEQSIPFDDVPLWMRSSRQGDKYVTLVCETKNGNEDDLNKVLWLNISWDCS